MATSQSIVDNENEEQDFPSIMTSNGAKPTLIEKLAAKNFADIEMVQAIETSDDIEEIVNLCGLSVQEKFNLKAVIKKLSKKKSIVDPEELQAVGNMNSKLEAMNTSIDLIAEITKKIENESGAHSKKIKEAFDRIRTCLKERENELMDRVHQIANEKKLKWAKIANELQAQFPGVKTKIETSEKMISKPIDMSIAVLTKRKEKILKMAEEVRYIKIVTKADSVSANKTMDVKLNEKETSDFLSKFGEVSTALVPILISVKDNAQNGVTIKWRASGAKPAKTVSYKLKFEWQKIQSLNKTNDDEKEQWQQMEMKKKIDEMNMQTVDVDFDAEIAFFAFRLRIFDQNEWSLPSNAMAVQMQNKCLLPKGLKASTLIKDNMKKLMTETVLPPALKNKRFELLLRGSLHGLTIKAFSERCQDKGSVLVIAQSNEYDRIFGGYTKIGFKKAANGSQEDRDAFLFDILPKTNKAHRFPVKATKKALYISKGYVIDFDDLRWKENGKDGYCRRSNYNYITTTDKTQISGGPNGWTIKNYEVWKVI